MRPRVISRQVTSNWIMMIVLMLLHIIFRVSNFQFGSITIERFIAAINVYGKVMLCIILPVFIKQIVFINKGFIVYIVYNKIKVAIIIQVNIGRTIGEG